MVKIVKITDETHRDLQEIQKVIVSYGTKSLPPQFEPILASLKEDKPSSYKVIIAVAVKFLRTIMEQTMEGRKNSEGIEGEKVGNT